MGLVSGFRNAMLTVTSTINFIKNLPEIIQKFRETKESVEELVGEYASNLSVEQNIEGMTDGKYDVESFTSDENKMFDAAGSNMSKISEYLKEHYNLDAENAEERGILPDNLKLVMDVSAYAAKDAANAGRVGYLMYDHTEATESKPITHILNDFGKSVNKFEELFADAKNNGKEITDDMINEWVESSGISDKISFIKEYNAPESQESAENDGENHTLTQKDKEDMANEIAPKQEESDIYGPVLPGQ